jgi:hypothetical protein
MVELSPIFEKILLKPELFLGANSVTRLRLYFEGYTAALRDANVPFDDQDLRNFFKWVENKFDFGGSYSWANIAIFVSFGDENRAIEMTKMLWIEYKNAHKYQ